jgi:MOB kinase activator 1
MSNFISTMFVSTPSGSHPTYPAKPKPLRPVSTFVESQSCMDLRIHTLEYHDRGSTSDIISQSLSSCEERSTPTQCAKSREMYKSPLQKLGEALQTPQAVLDLSAALAASRISTTTVYRSTNGAALRSQRRGLGTGGLMATGIPCENNHVTDIGLHSPFFSNPRTRAPFKPQKANRGTSSWQLRQYAEATLGSGSLRKAVKLPEGEDKDEWLAVNGAQPGSRRKKTSANLER